MKVILVNDVTGVGVKYDVKNVADGYAMNFLIPNGLAEVATDKKVKGIELMKKEQLAEEKEKSDVLTKALADLKKTKVEITQEANEKGRLFKGITALAIVKTLKEQKEIELSKESIQLKSSIKEVGEFDIELEAGGKKGVLKLVVKAS
ncbi:MAG: 50S ribosomal protein L9 [Candidatus Pacebacteria bacterium]|jgi:large subunit ribosomal protein L9|nr:50S ribosomal protein L9 [bacterium]MDP6528050.1 50S ribosomal protein L9 [Candidatus Paceibacterota bacterium]MDP6659576.1 50S ribosomal protein L9 [Candidatus Paceibacterota bacterium]|tara:strand:+ start:11462 stop:11905 length:444 start_codon:yes stop_codon:yes gene_type:complete